jgi:hypothetical protein
MLRRGPLRGYAARDQEGIEVLKNATRSTEKRFRGARNREDN